MERNGGEKEKRRKGVSWLCLESVRLALVWTWFLFVRARVFVSGFHFVCVCVYVCVCAGEIGRLQGEEWESEGVDLETGCVCQQSNLEAKRERERGRGTKTLRDTESLLIRGKKSWGRRTKRRDT